MREALWRCERGLATDATHSRVAVAARLVPVRVSGFVRPGSSRARHVRARSGGLGSPDLRGSSAPVGVAGAGEASGFFEDGEGAVDLAGFLVAAEEVADLAAGDALGAVFRERPDLVGGRVAERAAEDPAGGVEAVAPDRESGFEVRQADVVAGVEGGVDRGETDDVLVLSADGKGIVMRAEALREATAKAAQRASPKLKTRLSKGEKVNRKRIAEVGAVYEVKPASRTPAEVLAPTNEKVLAPPRAKNKWLTASVVEDAATVVADIFDEAQRRDPDR